MRHVIVKHRAPGRRDQFRPYPRRYLCEYPDQWRLWTPEMKTQWQNRPEKLRAPKLDFSFNPIRICLECERPVKVTEYCDGNWEIIHETCRYHRFAPDDGLTNVKDHPMLPVLFPNPRNVRTHHVGKCVLGDPVISGHENIPQSIYFLRCTGTHVNSLGQAITVGKRISRIKIGDMKKVAVNRATMQASVPETEPFEVRYALALLKKWEMDGAKVWVGKAKLEDKVRVRIACEDNDFKCGVEGRGIKAGRVWPWCLGDLTMEGVLQCRSWSG